MKLARSYYKRSRSGETGSYDSVTYVKIRIQVPVVLMNRRPQLELHLSVVTNPRYLASVRLLIIQVVPMAEPITLQMTWMQKT